MPTFSFQLTHNQNPAILVDKTLKLIYINDLVEVICCFFIEGQSEQYRIFLQHEKELLVSEILSMLGNYKTQYYDSHVIPRLVDSFAVKLFNTFRSYLDASYFPVKVPVKSDARGNLVETVRERTGGQMFYSLTRPGQTRGNHYHRRKVERFFVVNGEALIKMRKIATQELLEFKVSGAEPSFVDIPIFFTHNITNVGAKDLITIFWTNELFNSEDADTFAMEV